MSFADDMREEMAQKADESDEYEQGYTDGVQDERQRIVRLVLSKYQEYPRSNQTTAALDTLLAWINSGRSIK